MTFRSTLPHLAVPAAILLAAYLLAPHVRALPPSLSGLGDYGAQFLIALGIAAGIAFKRGRAVFALLTLAGAQVARQWYLNVGSPAASAYTAFALLCLIVPFNLAALSLLRERGILNMHGAQRLAVLAAEVALAAWLLRSHASGFADAVYGGLPDAQWLSKSPVPQLGLLAIALGFLMAFAMWIVRRSAIGLALASAILAFALAANAVTSLHGFETYIAAGALILTVAVMQDTFRMAFRDELTGLPSRRALNERLASLPRRYAVAMLDIDRFKGLNDRFGHDVGDQVLKMVGVRLARVGGGGRVYRYGGEEFSVVFPGKSADEALPHLEALRRDIAAYRLALRDPARKPQRKSARKQRGENSAPAHTVSVTISIGLAENDAQSLRPEEVIQAADRALYRAKSRGRNQVSR